MKTLCGLYLKSTPFGDDFVGGARAHTVGIVNGLCDAGVDLDVMTEQPMSEVRARQIVLDLRRDLKRELRRRAYDTLFEEAMNGYLRAHPKHYDFVYSRFDLEAFSALHLARRHGMICVAEYNASPAVGWKEVWLWHLKRTGRLWKYLVRRALTPLKMAQIRWNERVLLNGAHVVVVVSSILKDELVLRGVAAEKILICPNAVDPTVFVDKSELGHAVRVRYGIDEKHIVVGFSGTFGRWHGISELAEAILQSRDEKNLQYLLMGDGFMKEEMVRRLAGCGNVRFTGAVPFVEMPAHLSACDILLVANSWNPSDKRPFFGSPTKLFEYMAMGKAIVASRLEQIGEILTDEETCLQFVPGDAHAMSKAIVRLARDPALRAALGVRARAEVVAHHTWKNRGLCILDKVASVGEGEPRR